VTKDEMAGMDCARAVELLPWLLNGSLEVTERDALQRHLEACASCHRELTSTARAGRAFGQHPLAETLVDYALGQPIAGGSRTALEEHLAVCDTCREELDLVRSDGQTGALPSSLPSESRPGAAGWQGWRPLALAASLAALLAGSGLVFELAQRDVRSGAPEVNLTVIELLPDRHRTRGAGDPVAGLDPARSTAIVLITDLAESFDDYRVRMIEADGALHWESTGLEPGPDGDFTLLLPIASLPAGAVRLELEGLRDGEWLPLESYRLSS
jgi:hypothetical protein